MATKKQLIEAAFSFYRPHDRRKTAYTGELVDHKTGELFSPPSRTKQSFAAECDINNILVQFKQTGVFRHISAKAAQGSYQDLPDPIDFQESLELVLAAERSFETLPSKVRERFQNNPGEFLKFMADPANQDEAIKLGLATDSRPQDAPPPEPDPAPTPPLPPKSS